MSLHFFELEKLPDVLNDDDMLLLWLSLFKAETEEELAKINAMGVPVMKEAINAYQKITVSPEFKEIERMRSDARHNEASALRNAENQGILKGIETGRKAGRETEKIETARNALAKGISVEIIQEITGLDIETIKKLKEKGKA